MIEFFVEGKPIPKARPRVGVHGTYTPATTKAWVVSIAWTEMSILSGDGPSSSPLALSLHFWGAHGSADLDNLTKAVMDALNGIVYEDDKQIKSLSARVWMRSEIDTHVPGVQIVVKPL